MKLLVDNREPRGLKELLSIRLEDKVDFLNLEIGDFQIIDNSKNVVLLVERKSYEDLICSIKDGRYSEQSYRLNEYPLDNHKIYYLIEGETTNFINKSNQTEVKMLFSSIFSLSFLKEFSIIKSNGLLESGEFLIRFFEKIENLKISNNETKDYTSVIKSSKKSNITKDNINEVMLMQIPGISSTVSNQLMNEYQSIFNLVNKLREDENCLNNFKIKTKNSERKISKTIISNVKEFLLT